MLEYFLEETHCTSVNYELGQFVMQMVPTSFNKTGFKDIHYTEIEVDVSSEIGRM